MFRWAMTFIVLLLGVISIVALSSMPHSDSIVLAASIITFGALICTGAVCLTFGFSRPRIMLGDYTMTTESPADGLNKNEQFAKTYGANIPNAHLQREGAEIGGEIGHSNGRPRPAPHNRWQN